jgi:predicted NUDIX family NTP pyrophosphohydrolase
MPERSAGILLHRPGRSGHEVFLVHPGGPFWAGKDAAAWSIPKGRVDPGEPLMAAARREFSEEVGTLPSGDLVPLGEFKQLSGKLLTVFAVAGDFDPALLVSNTVEVEWPPRSGQRIAVPEVDRAAWFDLDTARLKLHKGQVPIIAALLPLLR